MHQAPYFILISIDLIEAKVTPGFLVALGSSE